MSDTKILFAAVVATILSTMVEPRVVNFPASNITMQPKQNQTDVDDVVNKTVCPIKVDYDRDENRVPRRIKIIKCAEQSTQCSENHKTNECCTLNKDNNHHLSCMEITDQVLVFYKDNTNKTLEMSVGCSCVISNVTKALSP